MNKRGDVSRRRCTLGRLYLDRLEPERLTRQLVLCLERLGHGVKLKPKDEAA